MFSYTARSFHSQLCCLAVILALLALPLTGNGTERSPILSAMATHLVPLDASLQSPPDGEFAPPSLATCAKSISLLPPLLALAAYRPSEPRRQTDEHFLASSGIIQIPNGRSPPSARFA